MSVSERAKRPLDVRGEVLASPAYKERCSILFELFCLSREIGKDPKRILAIQAGFAEILIDFQKKKIEFQQDGNEIGVAVVRRLILILKQIIDSIVWRVLGYDRIQVQLLAEHSQTGYLDDTVFNDFELAGQIVEKEGAVVFVNDLTTILRHADLTIIGQDGFSVLMETKHGGASKRSRRAIRQRRRLSELVSFLNTGTRVSEDRRDFIFKADVSIETHHVAVTEAIAQARKEGYHQVVVSDCLAIEVLGMDGETTEFPQDRPFDDVEHVVRFHNQQVFDRPATRIAPYGIFPLDHRSCFDLIAGNILLVATLNLDRLQLLYNQYGLTLEFPQPNEQEREAYLAAPIAERKKTMHLLKFTIRDGDDYLSQMPDLLARIGLEFLHEGTIVQADRQLMNLIKNLDIPDDKATRFYGGYRDESSVWK